MTPPPIHVQCHSCFIQLQEEKIFEDFFFEKKKKKPRKNYIKINKNIVKAL